MDASISHQWSDESIEAKARWFQSLTIQERAELFCNFTELILEINPEIAKKDAQPIEGRIRLLREV
jgi:hypothetical protein